MYEFRSLNSWCVETSILRRTRYVSKSNAEGPVSRIGGKNPAAKKCCGWEKPDIYVWVHGSTQNFFTGLVPSYKLQFKIS